MDTALPIPYLCPHHLNCSEHGVKLQVYETDCYYWARWHWRRSALVCMISAVFHRHRITIVIIVLFVRENEESIKSCSEVTRWGHARLTETRACPRFFSGGNTEGSKADGKDGVLGQGWQPPFPQLEVWRALWALLRGSGEAQTALRFSTIFSTRDGLSRHYCGLSCSHWGKFHVPSLAMPCSANSMIRRNL